MTNNTPAIKQREITDQILNRVGEMKTDGLVLPANYNASNALNVAFLQLVDMKVKNQPLLEVVTQKSVVESLLNMVLQGLTPAKNQVYFIAYGNQLQMQRSYFGTQTALKRLEGINDIWANVVYEGDDFDIYIDEKGRERLDRHKTSFLNRDNDIIAAYAIVDTVDDGQLVTVMTRKEIEKSWSQAKTTNVQKAFPQEMAKRTVINRAAKSIINSSDDSDMLAQAINSTTENEYDNNINQRKDITPTEKSQELLSDFKPQETKAEPEKEVVEETSTEDVAQEYFDNLSQEELDELNATPKDVTLTEEAGEVEEVTLFDTGVKSKLG